MFFLHADDPEEGDYASECQPNFRPTVFVVFLP